MKFNFRELPEPGGAAVRPRPIVDLVVEGLDIAPQACLIDSGATAVRFGAHVAELCGLELADAPQRELAVGGTVVTARMEWINLRVSDAHDTHEWRAPAWFCEPWVPAFGLLGLAGFFDHFVVTLASYEERIQLDPIGHR